VCAAASLQALKGWPTAFDERIVHTRPFSGAVATARNIRRLIVNSPLLAETPARVHDPYCLRCVPQIHGASRDAFAYARSATLLELNAETDNPLVFAEDDSCLSGGNFHAQPVGIPMDVLAIAVAELGSVSQRRTQHLVAPVYDIGLPPKLSPEPKRGSGLFMLNTAASALVSENRTLAFPASVDTMAVDTTEDHVSMGSVAARKASWIIRNTARILALELICACQALDLHRPSTASPPIEAVHTFVRGIVPFVERDRALSKEIAVLSERILEGDVAG
jgi:histidine ammonia-lyase